VIVELAHGATNRWNDCSRINCSAYLKYSFAASCWNEQGWRYFTSQRAKLRVADDAHDLLALALMAYTSYVPPERILLLKKGAGKGLVDHSGFPRGVWRQREILRCKQAPGHQGNTHGFEELRTRRKAERLVLRVLVFSFDSKAGVPIIAAQQGIKGIGCGKHAWNCLKTR